jgi:hypothetical protein
MREEEIDNSTKIIPWIRRKRLLFIAIVGLLFLVAPLGRVSQFLGFDYFTFEAQKRLDASLEENLIVFATLSTIKAGLAIIEGSSVGVTLGASIQVELGDLIQPAFDYLDVTWHIFLYALFILSFYRLLLESNFLSLGLPLIGMGMIGLSLVPVNQPEIKRWVRSFIFIGLTMAYGIPLALICSDTVAKNYISPVRARTVSELKQAEVEFSTIRKEFTDLRSEVSLIHPGKSAEAIKEGWFRIADKITAQAWKSLKALLSYILILSMELLILPALMAYVISSVLKIGFMQVTLSNRSIMTK